MHLVFEVTVLVFKHLVGVFFTARNSLQFSQILSIGENRFDTCVLLLKSLKFAVHLFDQVIPLFIQLLILLQLDSDVALVLLVVS